MADKTNRTRGLGRGLSALMADVSPVAAEDDGPRRADLRLPIEKIFPNPDQPRRSFGEELLDELAASIRERGIIQPLIVRPDPRIEGCYQIVAGERRWRAAQRAQLHDVPVVLRNYTDTEVLEVAIIENIQRADLNAIDEAAGYKQLMDRFGHTQDKLGTALGKSRSHIANLLRLLNLPDDVQAHVIAGTLSAGHARTLVGHPEASALAARIIAAQLSVRETEQLVKSANAAPKKAPSRPKPGKDPDTIQIEQELAATLKMGVSISQNHDSEGGSLTLHYRNLEQLDDLLRTLSGS